MIVGERPRGMRPGESLLSWEERFWSRVDKRGDSDACWIWTGGRGGRGGDTYGVYMRPGQRRVGAHVLAYEFRYGPLPDGHVPDHLCAVPLCVNPAHLEAVTPEENRRRQAERVTRCRAGHPLSDSYVDAKGSRHCRRCHTEAQRRYRERGAGRSL